MAEKIYPEMNHLTSSQRGQVMEENTIKVQQAKLRLYNSLDYLVDKITEVLEIFHTKLLAKQGEESHE